MGFGVVTPTEPFGVLQLEGLHEVFFDSGATMIRLERLRVLRSLGLGIKGLGALGLWGCDV